MGVCVHDEEKTNKWHQQHPLTSVATTTTVALCSGDCVVVVVVMALRACVVCLCRQVCVWLRV